MKICNFISYQQIKHFACTFKELGGSSYKIFGHFEREREKRAVYGIFSLDLHALILSLLVKGSRFPHHNWYVYVR